MKIINPRRTSVKVLPPGHYGHVRHVGGCLGGVEWAVRVSQWDSPGQEDTVKVWDLSRQYFTHNFKTFVTVCYTLTFHPHKLLLYGGFSSIHEMADSSAVLQKTRFQI